MFSQTVPAYSIILINLTRKFYTNMEMFYKRNAFYLEKHDYIILKIVKYILQYKL